MDEMMATSVSPTISMVAYFPVLLPAPLLKERLSEALACFPLLTSQLLPPSDSSKRGPPSLLLLSNGRVVFKEQHITLPCTSDDPGLDLGGYVDQYWRKTVHRLCPSSPTTEALWTITLTELDYREGMPTTATYYYTTAAPSTTRHHNKSTSSSSSSSSSTITETHRIRCSLGVRSVMMLMMMMMMMILMMLPKVLVRGITYISIDQMVGYHQGH